MSFIETEEEHQDGRVVRSREGASLRLIIQMLDYSNARKTRRREVVSQDSGSI